MRVDDMVQQILSVGQGCLTEEISKSHSETSQFTLVTATSWACCDRTSYVYIDTVLTFGLRSARKTYKVVADSLQRVAKARGVSYLKHFLDDYTTYVPYPSDRCWGNEGLAFETILLQTSLLLNLPTSLFRNNLCAGGTPV